MARMLAGPQSLLVCWRTTGKRMVLRPVMGQSHVGSLTRTGSLVVFGERSDFSHVHNERPTSTNGARTFLTAGKGRGLYQIARRLGLGVSGLVMSGDNFFDLLIGQRQQIV